MNSRLLTTAALLSLLPLGSALARPQSAPPKPAAAALDKDKAHPDQSTVASKKQFGTVSEASAGHALDAKDIVGAQKLIGKPSSFQGTVSKVFSPGDHDIVILDFSPQYREALTAVLMPAAYAQFPDMRQLSGKRVLIHGTFKSYHGKPQIELTAPSQVRILH